MRIDWSSLLDGAADEADGHTVEITGWPVTATDDAQAAYCLLAPEPVCCRGCLPSDPLACVEVLAAGPLPLHEGQLTLTGRWRVLRDDSHGWRYRVTDSVPIGEHAPFRLSRRNLLAGLPLLCWPVAAAAQVSAVPAPDETVERLLSARPAIDIHSHAGAILHVRQDGGNAPFTPLAEPMREGRVAVACLAIVSDSPTHRVTADGRIRAFRDPAAGELRAYALRGFERLHALIQAQGLSLVRTAGDLEAARSTVPSVLVAAEGADFLEGELWPLDAAFDRAALRHLQLTHYRPNELGDIQTEAPVHGGLTAFGADVIRHCEARGIIVDVAHATEDLVRQAAKLATKPLVLSHTSLTTAPRPRTRLITPDHARVIAETNGVIGIWPPASVFADLGALVDGITRMADVVGPAHVGIGTDMMGLVGPSTLGDYSLMPNLASHLVKRFSSEETLGILGGNYLRVAKACFKA